MKIRDIFPQWKSGKGFFYYLSQIPDITLPWGSYKTEQDIAYITHSGEKNIAPIVKAFLSTSGTLSESDAKIIASAVYDKYGLNWGKLYATLSLEYNPIENYSMTEDTTTNRDGTSSQIVDTANNSSVYGFNSTEASPSDEVSGVNESNGDTHETVIEGKTRSGNIGVTTSQQMIEAERSVWIWNFWDAIFKDIDKELTLRIY